VLRTDYRLWRPGKWWWKGEKGAIEGCHGTGGGWRVAVVKGPEGVKIIVNHQHSLRHYHSKVSYSVKARGRIAVKERGVDAVRSRAGI